MNIVKLLQPARIEFGVDSLKLLPNDRLVQDASTILLVVAEPLLAVGEEIMKVISIQAKSVTLMPYIYPGEPTFALFDSLLKESRAINPDLVIGIGGGSVLDTAKLLAAMIENEQDYRDVVGVGRLLKRHRKLICVSTTSGTGSEVSPISILLDESTSTKNGIVSEALLADAAYIDPSLSVGLPPRITAETAVDALCHCIEAYTNINSHVAVDTYALKGISLIASQLRKAYDDGTDLDARSALALGSMYGGLCLGPVNTHGVHCLSYGLGGKYKVTHGLANAVLLPAVLEFILPVSAQRLADVALAMGVDAQETLEATARAGIQYIRELSAYCGIPATLTELGISSGDLSGLADIAMGVTRLLKNSPRPISHADAVGIYNSIL